MRKLLSLLGVGIALFGLAASGRAQDQAPEPGTVVPAGDVRNRHGFYSLVFYFTPEPRVPADATARALIGEYFPGLPIVDDPAQTPKPPFIAIETETAPLQNFPVPEAGYFKYAGRGLSADDIAAIQQTKLAFRLILITPKADVWTQTKKFTELGHAFAVKTGAFLWDSATRECFSPATWKTRRLDTWTDPIPNLPEQFTIHAYRVAETNYVRAITLGMEKFALPDLVIQQLLASETRSGGNLINVSAQLLAENPEVDKPAAFPLSLSQCAVCPINSLVRCEPRSFYPRHASRHCS